MTLTVETGGANPSADSYASTADADSYINDWHDDADWNSASEQAKERALRKGTRFVDAHRFLGYRLSQSQALDWPRDGVGIVDGQHVYPGTVPAAIKRAAMEAALRVVKGDDLLPDHDGGTIKRLSQQVGELSETTEFETPRQAGKRYEAIQAILKPYLQSGSSRRLTRSIG